MNQNLNIIVEVWAALSNHIDLNDRSDAADSLVSLLVDNNYEAEEIREAFYNDKEILTAIKDYVTEHDTDDQTFSGDHDDDDEDDGDIW